MTNSSFERMEHLCRLLGLDMQAGGANAAELKACAAGLDLVYDMLEQLNNQLNPNTADEPALSLYCNLFGADGALDEAEKRAQINKGFAALFGDYENGALERIMEQYGVNCDKTAGQIILENNDIQLTGLPEHLSRILDDYQSPTSGVTVRCIGVDFAYWDSTDYSFCAYDCMNLPFYILNALNGE